MGANAMGIFEVKTITVSSVGAIAQHLRVKFSTTAANGIVDVVVAGLADDGIGSVITPIPAGGRGTVMLEGSGGMHIGTANGAIAIGAKVYSAAAGKVSATAASTSRLVGICAAVAAAADGDLVNYIPVPNGGVTA